MVGQAPGQGSGQKRWVERALLNEARGSVRGVEFGPNAFGLKLVSGSFDEWLAFGKGAWMADVYRVGLCM
jgi:hypothetical protein